MIRILAFVDRSLIKKLQSVPESKRVGTIVCFDSNESLSSTDRLMGANARRKTAYELVHVLDAQGTETKRLPRCLFQALNAAIRIKQQLRALPSF